MSIKQISVFVENKPGEMHFVTKVLGKHGIDMRALSLAETTDFGIVRLIVDDPDRAAAALKEAGCLFSLSPVLGVEIPDEPGSLSRILDLLAENDINLEYTYAFITRKSSSAYMIFRVADNEKTAAILLQNGIQLVSQDELSQL